MKTQRLFGHAMVASLCVLSLLAGCASVKTMDRQQFSSGYIPRPNQIWVYDFAGTPADVAPNSAFTGQSAYAVPQTYEEIAEGRKLGAEIAGELVQEINAMGMPAAIASAATRPQVNDIVIEGSILSVQQGSAAERVTIGFSAGGSELQAAVEGFQMTEDGLRELGSGDLDATGAKTPGVGFGLASMLATHNPAGFIISAAVKAHGERSGSATVDGRAKQIAKQIAEVLKKRFQQQGWI